MNKIWNYGKIVAIYISTFGLMACPDPDPIPDPNPNFDS